MRPWKPSDFAIIGWFIFVGAMFTINTPPLTDTRIAITVVISFFWGAFVGVGIDVNKG